jgi:amylosucrase
MAASLAGLESAIETGNDRYRELALRRIELIFSVIISAGGIPLIYLGDEIAMLNDYRYRDDPDKFDDSRWVHRLAFDWDRANERKDPNTDAGRIFQTVTRLIDIRRRLPAFANGETQFLSTRNDHVLGYVRGGQLLILANFIEEEQSVRLGWIPQNPVDLVTGDAVDRHKPISLAPYQFVWLAPGNER